MHEISNRVRSERCSTQPVTTSGLTRASLMASIIAVLSFIAVPLPFSPVPITLQTLGVMLAGLVLGPQLGTIAVCLYLVAGTSGLPIFAGGAAGIGVLMGPSGGYLLGFLPGTWVIGVLSQERNRHNGSAKRAQIVVRNLLSCAIGGILIIHTCGILHLARSAHLSLANAMLLGTVPFLLGDVLKAVIASTLAQRIAVALKL